MSKKLIITSVILLVVGFTISLIVLFSENFEFSDMSHAESKTYEINGEFENIRCDLDVADLNIYLANDDKNTALCIEDHRSTFTVEVVDNTLIVKEIFENKIFNFSSYAEVSLFLNKDTFTSLIVTGSTGDIEVSDVFKFKDASIDISTGDISFMALVEGDLKINLSTGDTSIYKAKMKNLSIECSTGQIKVQECEILNNCKLKFSTGRSDLDNTIIGNDLTINGTTGDFNSNDSKVNNANIKLSTGDCTLTNFVASNTLTIETSTGDVKFDGSDAKNINVNTDTGSVKGTILTEKIFDVKTDTGDISHPKTYTGGICKIKTDTGDVKISYK